MTIRFKQQMIITNRTSTGLSPFAGKSLEDVLNSYKNIDRIISDFTDYFCRVSTPEAVHPKGTSRYSQMISFPEGQAICQIAAISPNEYHYPSYEVLVHRNGENFFYKYIFNCELEEKESHSDQD